MKFLAVLALIYGFTACVHKPLQANPDLEYAYGSFFMPEFQAALPDDCILLGMTVGRMSSQAIVSCKDTRYSIMISPRPFAARGRCVDTTDFTVCVMPDAPELANITSELLSATPEIRQLYTGQALNLRILDLWTALMAVMLVLIVLAAARAFLKSSGRDRLMLSGLFVLALALRLVFGLWAPIHANGHGIAEAEGVIRGIPFFMEGFSKGPLWYFLTTHILRIGLFGYQGLFVVNAVLSALASMFLFLAVRNFGQRVVPAALSALIPIMFPGLVVLSATEAPQNFVIFTVSLAVFFVARYHRTRKNEDLLTALGSLIIGASLFFESAVLLIPFFVLLWGDRRIDTLTSLQKTGLTVLGLFLWLPQGIFLLSSAGETDFITRFLQAVHAPFGLWNIYPYAFWGFIIVLIAGVYFVWRQNGIFLPGLMFSGLIMAVFALGASGWSTDPVRYQSEAVFFAMPVVMLVATRFRGITAMILTGIFLWTLIETPAPDTLEQQEFRFLQSSATRIQRNRVIKPPAYQPRSDKGAVCGFPASLFQPQNPVFYGQLPFDDTGLCYYGCCQAARGIGIHEPQWQAHTSFNPASLNRGWFRYGVSYPSQVVAGFYQCRH